MSTPKQTRAVKFQQKLVNQSPVYDRNLKVLRPRKKRKKALTRLY